MSGERFGFDDLEWGEFVDATVRILRGVAGQCSTIPYGQLSGCSQGRRDRARAPLRVVGATDDPL